MEYRPRVRRYIIYTRESNNCTSQYGLYGFSNKSSWFGYSFLRVPALEMISNNASYALIDFGLKEDNVNGVDDIINVNVVEVYSVQYCTSIM